MRAHYLSPSPERVALMAGLDLALDYAYHDGTPFELALAAEAYSRAGYEIGTASVAHASHAELLERVAAARRGRHRRPLEARAAGFLEALGLLAGAGILTYANGAEATRQRWLERGGHDGPK